MKEKVIFLDIDDTLADTSKYVTQKFNINFFTLSDKKLFLKNIVSIMRVWFKIKKQSNFWEEIPLRKDAYLTYAKAKQVTSNIHILTALPIFFFKRGKEDFKLAAEAKKRWVKKHFPEIPEANIHVCYAKEKHLKIKKLYQDFLHQIFILVDDSEKNIIRWNNAGGIGILVEEDSSSHLFKLNSFISKETNKREVKINLK